VNLLDPKQIKLLTNLFKLNLHRRPNAKRLNNQLDEPHPKKLSLISSKHAYIKDTTRISGFRMRLGIREALFSIQVLIQRAQDVNADVFASFRDFEKAFDTVQHGKLILILRESGNYDRDTDIISKQQKAIVECAKIVHTLSPLPLSTSRVLRTSI